MMTRARKRNPGKSSARGWASELEKGARGPPLGWRGWGLRFWRRVAALWAHLSPSEPPPGRHFGHRVFVIGAVKAENALAGTRTRPLLRIFAGVCRASRTPTVQKKSARKKQFSAPYGPKMANDRKDICSVGLISETPTAVCTAPNGAVLTGGCGPCGRGALSRVAFQTDKFYLPPIPPKIALPL